MNILDKIKLIIEARSFYIKKAYIPDFCVLEERYFPTHILSTYDALFYYLKDKYELKVKRLVKYQRDEQKFRWVVWYI